ncbi:glycosyl hydrolase, partial [Streptomyces beijiangensis]|nr:glycosyl hydrolase [Streptomyces beijiangensis]
MNSTARRIRSVGICLIATLALLLPVTAGVATAAPESTICNKYCDARDSALSPGYRQPVTAAIHFCT